MRRKLVLVSLLLGLALLGPASPGRTDPSSPIPADLLDSLRRQGWIEVSPGVMQRSLGGNRIETLGFGAAGLRFQLEELKAHLADLRKDYAEDPSRQLRIAIRAQRAQILRVEKALQKAGNADGIELSTEALIARGPDCSADYDASAFAFPLTQGASASASAYFNNGCGYVGEAYAHSKSKATNTNNAVTLQTKSDPAPDTPRIGENVSASASTSVDGVSNCDSYAYASVMNYDLEITYAQSDQSFECVETLPSPWVKTDVGAVGLAGRASHANGVFKLIAGGSDLWGTDDAFHFVHQTLTGDGEIVANVAALLKPAGAKLSLAGVTFRNDLTAGSAHATMTITNEGEAKLRYRTTAGGSTLRDTSRTRAAFPPQWLKLVRSGNVFTAFLSADGVTWAQVDTPQTVSMAATVHVGLVALRNGSSAPAGAARFEQVRAVPRANHALLANGATATASSTLNAGHMALAAINGDRRGNHWGTDPGTGSGWHDLTANDFPDWLEITFKGERKVDEVHIFSVQDNYSSPIEPTGAMVFTDFGLTDFRVEYWDGSAWQTVPGGVVTANNKVWRKLSFAPLTTTRLRVVVNSAPWGYSRVVEVEAWGPQPVNHALAANGATVTASSTLDAGLAPLGAINGDRRGIHWGTDASTGSGWHDATVNDFPDWLEVTFAGSKPISEVHVFSVQDNYLSPVEPTEAMTFTSYGNTAMYLESWNGSAWQPIPGATAVGNNQVWRKFAFAPLTTSKIRVVVNGGGMGFSRIVEVEAY
jgi:hypothetical protein